MPRRPATPPPPYQPNLPSVPTGETGPIADAISAASESILARLSPTTSEIGIENYGKQYTYIFLLPNHAFLDPFDIPPPVRSDATCDNTTIHHTCSSMSIGLDTVAAAATTTPTPPPEPAPSEPTKPFEILVWVTRPPKK